MVINHIRHVYQLTVVINDKRHENAHLVDTNVYFLHLKYRVRGAITDWVYTKVTQTTALNVLEMEACRPDHWMTKKSPVATVKMRRGKKLQVGMCNGIYARYNALISCFPCKGCNLPAYCSLFFVGGFHTPINPRHLRHCLEWVQVFESQT